MPEEVRVSSRLGMTFPGYFFSGTNGATIIIPPAYGQDRSGWLNEAAVLIRAGYGVLAYDSRTCLGIAPHSLASGRRMTSSTRWRICVAGATWIWRVSACRASPRPEPAPCWLPRRGARLAPS